MQSPGRNSRMTKSSVGIDMVLIDMIEVHLAILINLIVFYFVYWLLLQKCFRGFALRQLQCILVFIGH